jgi:hypothetical protein
MANNDGFFSLKDAEHIEFEGSGPFLLPLCENKAGILMGEDMGVVILEALEGHQFGIPLSHEALSILYRVIGDALSDLRPGDQTVQ